MFCFVLLYGSITYDGKKINSANPNFISLLISQSLVDLTEVFNYFEVLSQLLRIFTFLFKVLYEIGLGLLKHCVISRVLEKLFLVRFLVLVAYLLEQG